MEEGAELVHRLGNECLDGTEAHIDTMGLATFHRKRLAEILLPQSQ